MAPFKSEAQRRKMIQLEKEGKLSPGTVERWESETTVKKLPERAAAVKAHRVKRAKVIK